VYLATSNDDISFLALGNMRTGGPGPHPCVCSLPSHPRFAHRLLIPWPTRAAPTGDWGCGKSNCAVPLSAPLGYQNGASNTQRVAAAMAAAASAMGSQFVLALGDNFYFRGVSSIDDPLFEEVWEKQFSAPSLLTPWYVILGNHDHYGNPEAQIDFGRQDRDCQARTHAHDDRTHTTHFLSLSLSLSHSHSHSISLSLPFAHSLFPSLSLSLSHTHTRVTHTFTHTYT